jgi:hypothetical protein
MPCGGKGSQGDSAPAEAWPPVFADLRRPAVMDVGTHQKRSSLQWGVTAMWDGTTGPQYGVGMANGGTIHLSPHRARLWEHSRGNPLVGTAADPFGEAGGAANRKECPLVDPIWPRPPEIFQTNITKRIGELFMNQYLGGSYLCFVSLLAGSILTTCSFFPSIAFVTEKT